MKKLVVFLLAVIALSCDDGNVDIPEFNFSDAEIENCGDLVLYKINENETLIIELSNSATDENFFTTDWDNEEFTLASDAITYRTLDSKPGSDYFCQNIPPTTPNIINEWIGSGELLIVDTFTTRDDEDGVSGILECNGNDPNGDEDGDNIPNYSDTTDDGNDGDASITDYTDTDENDIPDVYEIDSDNDTFPDYIDRDDDNDGILTKDEDPNEDNDPTNDNTDGDALPNYLDNDDDGDGVPSIEESITNDDDLDTIVDYLDSDTTTSDLRTITPNQYQEIYTTTFTIELLELTNANDNTKRFDVFDFGTTSNEKPKSE